MLAGDSFTFKRVIEADLPLLYKWFQEPHVSKWWPVPKKEEEFFASFLKRIRSTEIAPYIVEYNGIPIGYIQSYPIDRSKEKWLPELPENTIGIDQFIGDNAYVGKGYGTLFIREFIRQQKEKDHTITIILDPEPTNKAAIRCYEKVGFVSMGVFDRSGGPALLMRYN